MITVTAGSEKATIDVTQSAAGKEQYPDTEAKLKQAIAKVWTFAESSNYVSLEFTTDGLYTFLSKTPFTRAAENNIYLLFFVQIFRKTIRFRKNSAYCIWKIYRRKKQ